MRTSLTSIGALAAIVLAACAPPVTPAVGAPAQASVAGQLGSPAACAGNPGAPAVDGWMRRFLAFLNPQLNSGGHSLTVPWRAVPNNLSIAMQAPPGDRMIVQIWELERVPVHFAPNTPELTIDITPCFPAGGVPELVVHHVPVDLTAETLVLHPTNPDYRETRRIVVDVEFTGDFIVALP